MFCYSFVGWVCSYVVVSLYFFLAGSYRKSFRYWRTVWVYRQVSNWPWPKVQRYSRKVSKLVWHLFALFLWMLSVYTLDLTCLKYLCLHIMLLVCSVCYWNSLKCWRSQGFIFLLSVSLNCVQLFVLILDFFVIIRFDSLPLRQVLVYYVITPLAFGRSSFNCP